ncbi:MAG TPA: Nif3-like dinuclear metal center hexameric protein [Terriglobales bacterium]|nr:Nif3-like dinuclear metal center hexameric protein [Terriglobales bacterium]
MTISLEDLARYTDGLLETQNTPDYPNAVNGVQLNNESPIRKIAAAVDFSTRAVEGAIASGANLLIVHHGIFWGGLEPLSGPRYRRIRMLIEADIAVYASHLPLDRHPRLGNNVLLAKALGLQPSAPFASFEETFIGLCGESDLETATLITSAREFARTRGGDLRTSLVQAGRRTRKWAICTGAGALADTLREASTVGVDTLIVGEGPHWTAIHAEENDLVIIYAGHYATETLGVCALAQHLGEKYDLPWNFVSAPTGL